MHITILVSKCSEVCEKEVKVFKAKLKSFYFQRSHLLLSSAVLNEEMLFSKGSCPQSRNGSPGAGSCCCVCLSVGKAAASYVDCFHVQCRDAPKLSCSSWTDSTPGHSWGHTETSFKLHTAWELGLVGILSLTPFCVHI